ncbi:MAG: RHS repeat-associated core domain-containing protein, partial [Mucilaginibacter sp.]|nr:RHS repeat-associated core domain-containing protein [Mucilaginibacter sp.]
MVLLSQQEYNEVGQLFKKKLHSTNGGSSFYQTITYRYNARGWMVQDSAQLFKQQLYYNDGSVPQYNGNISAQSWQTNGGALNTYNYTYDTQNRLLSGIATNCYSEKGITYDLMGSMRTLARFQANTLIDSLRFNYPNNGQSNQPDTIRDVSGNLTAGAKTATMAYTYRGDGQMKYDGRTGNTINYNLLALPQTVTGTNNITYWYDTDGEKLAKISITGSTTTRTDYIGGIQYTSSNGATPVVEFIQTGEGRARLSGSNYIYEYDLTDHLGNARLTFATAGASPLVVQTTDYYPFGTTSNETLNGIKSKYLYNKKEWQEETNQYDYGARFYDPVIGRWTSVDPLAESYYRWSPYNYGADNPVYYVDKDGRFIGTLIGAAVGAIVGGVSAAIKHENVWKGAGKGAIAGAVAGAVVDITVATAGTGTVALVAAGGLSGAAG